MTESKHKTGFVILITLAATIGAIVIFVVARRAAGGGPRGRAGGALDRLERGLQHVV